jgi:hypothetical protein
MAGAGGIDAEWVHSLSPCLFIDIAVYGENDRSLRSLVD